jgi:hypothetical protein
MTKFAKQASRNIQAGFTAGLSDMISIVGYSENRPFPGTHRSDADALRGDWEKLGGDMRKAVDRVSQARGKK